MKVLYYLRVFFVSFEFLTLVTAYFVYSLAEDFLANYLSSTTLNEDALKWIVLFPVTIIGWILKEGVSVLFPDEKLVKIFHEWPDFWKLKVHFNVGLFYCLLGLPCILVWLMDKVATASGVVVFVGCSLALVINAYSFYSAKIQVKSALIHFNG